MKQRIILLLCSMSISLAALQPIPIGTPLWCIQQQTGQTVDLIESKVEEIINSAGTAGGCAFTEIEQANVIGGVLSLTASGNYCLTEDIVADVVITGSCIYFDLNEHEIGTDGSLGHLTIIGQYATVINGSFISPEGSGFLPNNSVTILPSSDHALLRNLHITTLDSNSVSAANGINNQGLNSTIKNCIIKTGSGRIAFINGQNAGHGIVTTGKNAIIQNC